MGRKYQQPRFNEDFDIIANAKVGDIIVPDRGYSYATFDKTLAQGWTSSSGESILYEIHVPKGAKLSCNMEHGGEALFPRGAEYRLISKEKVDNTTTVKMEYILPGN